MYRHDKMSEATGDEPVASNDFDLFSGRERRYLYAVIVRLSATTVKPGGYMDVVGFVAALFTGWIAIMSTIASLALYVFGLFWAQLNQKRLFYIAAITCFFFAAMRAWTIEHNKTTPQFTGRIETARIYPGSVI